MTSAGPRESRRSTRFTLNSNSDRDLAEEIARSELTKGFGSLVKREGFIDDRLNAIHRDGPVHVFEHGRAAYADSLQAAGFHHEPERSVFALRAAQKADQCNLPAEPERIIGARQSPGPANLNHDIGAAPSGEFVNFPVPFGSASVVNAVRRAQAACPVELLIARRRDDHAGPGRFGELHGMSGNASGAQAEHRIPWLHGLAEDHQRAPGGNARARQSGSLFE